MADLQSQHSSSNCSETNSSAAAAYELTVDGACSESVAMLAHAPQQHAHHDPRKRKSSQYSESYELSCEAQLPASPAPPLSNISASRKHKLSSTYGTGSVYDNDEGEDTSSTRTDKKQNHSEIEKRRRDKMNTYISELSSMVPMCGAMARKLDKLTVLRMAVQHLRTVRGSLTACPLTARPRPAYLSEREVNGLIIRAAQDCFLFVVGCDRGKLLYVSASVEKMLYYDQSELLGQSLFDILHPKDVAKVKEQLSSPELGPRERYIDAKTMLPVRADVVTGASRLCPGARRSFLCRIKCKSLSDNSTSHVKEEDEVKKMTKKQNEKKYCVIQCTGYLKSWTAAEISDDVINESGEDGETCNLFCLVAVCRALPDLPLSPFTVPPTRQLQYMSRHATDGKFLFVDQRVTLVLGFLPQELLGTSLYEYVGGGQLGAVTKAHKAALLRQDALLTPPYPFRRKDGTMATIQTHFKPFRNPWTKDVEYLVAKNTMIELHATLPATETFDVLKQKEVYTTPGDVVPLSEADADMQQLIDSQIESNKIGSAIAEEALRRSPSEFFPEVPMDFLQDVVFDQQATTLVDNILGNCDMENYTQVGNNVALSSVGADSSTPPPEMGDILPLATPPPASPPLGLDGNGEAAMTVIMSLLEADAGLGGPVNFSGLPWPLP